MFANAFLSLNRVHIIIWCSKIGVIIMWDAAEIWASNGKDEDYMFGYSEDELEDAL